jgi:hypothetical protein
MVLALLIGLGVRLSDRLHPQEKPVKVTS